MFCLPAMGLLEHTGEFWMTTPTGSNHRSPLTTVASHGHAFHVVPGTRRASVQILRCVWRRLHEGKAEQSEGCTQLYFKRMTSNKYAVMGVGCIGGAVGISLGASRYDVVFVGRKSETFAVLESSKKLSLKVPEPKAQPLVLDPANLTSNPEAGLSDRNVILVATKRTANPALAQVVAAHAQQGALIILLQNGLNAAQEFGSLLAKANREDLIVLDSAFSCFGSE
jgi:hypothetical protein